MPEKLEFDEEAAAVVRRALELDEILPDMGAADILSFFPKSGLYRYADGEALLRQGESDKDMCVVVAGTVAVTRRGGASSGKLGELGAGALLGEIAVLRGEGHAADASAAGEARVFRLSAPDVESLLTGNPALAEHLKRLALKRLRG